MRKTLRNCFQSTNIERGRQGERPYKRSVVLNRSAQAKARQLAKSGDLEHGLWWKLIDKFAQKRYGSIGENIARGQNTSEQVVREWMNSPAHRKNILATQFTHMGVGMARRGDEEYWVQHFGGTR